MTGRSRALAALFLLALAGVLVVVGIVAAELGGLPLLLGCAAALAALLGLATARGRRLAAARRRPSTARCTCCDGDHTAPVRVV